MLQELWTRNYETFLGVVELTEEEINQIENIPRYILSEVESNNAAKCSICGETAIQEINLIYEPCESNPGGSIELMFNGSYCEHFRGISSENEFVFSEQDGNHPDEYTLVGNSWKVG